MFNVGDKIVCINNRNISGGLIPNVDIDGLYRIGRWGKHYVHIVDNKGSIHSLRPDRFISLDKWVGIRLEKLVAV